MLAGRALARATIASTSGGALAFAALHDDADSSAARFGRTFWHASVVGYEYKYGAATKLPAGSAERKAALAETHQRSAERLLHVCRRHGGLYTKLGQFVASLNHILPPQYPEVLAACQDRAPAVSFDEVRPLIESELGCRVEEAFAHFDPTPIAAASLAQVHRARTADEGLTVAVKVQYPALARQVAADLRTVRVLVGLLGYAFEGHSYDWLLPEFEGSIRAELDFRLEAAKAARTAAFFAYEPRLHVPVVLPRLSGARVLTMEYIEGVKVTDAAGLKRLGLKPQRLASLISDVFSAMIFGHGRCALIAL
jgi:aarF domain-containing kinase